MICKRFRKVISIFLLVSVLVNSSFNIIIPVYGAEPTEFGDIQVFMPDAPVIGNTETISSSTIAVPDFPMQNIMPRTIFPAQYNLERNWQTPVKDQGRTNLCWAYASIDAIEASTYKNTGTMMNFSVRHLAHATSSHGGNVAGFNRSPGAAGYPTMVMSYAMRGMLHGMVLHVDDPMPNAPTGLAARPVAQTAAIPAGYHVPSSYQLTNLNMSQAVRNARIKQGVMEFGAVAIVQRAPSGRGFNPIHNTWNSGSTSTNHVVTVVGWDANFSGDLFNTRPQGDGAWLVKNTWGDWWGDNGYFWMSFYDFIGGAYVFSPVTSFPTDIANIYEFDIPGTHGWVTPIFHMANVFTAENPNEILTSVRIFNNLVGERVDIFFIPDFDSVNLLNGVSQGWLSPVYSFTATRAGFHNIELPLHVQAAVGNRFALVTSSSTGRMPMASNNLGGETYQFFNGSWAPSRFAASVKGVTGMPAEGVLSYRIVGSGITRFNSLEVGYTDAALQTRTVSVTNVGTGTVTLEQPNQLVNFTLGSLSETVLAPGEVATFTVRPNLGLGVGSYSENILISGSNFTNAMIPVGITILQNSQLTGHGVTIVGEPDFGARRQGAATPVHTFHVTNHSGVTRNVWAMFRGPNPYFIVSGIQQGAANSVSGVPNTPNGGTLTFNVQPRAGLPPGTYIEEIPIAVNLTFASLLTITITARFTVYPNGEASAISISATGEGATASSLNFPGIIFGEPSLNSREITVSNIGDIAVTLEQPSFINFNAGLLSNSELRPGESSTFMLYPRSGLNAGIYIEPITVVGSGEAKASILADFSVLGVSPLTGHGVTITGETDFGVQLQGETPPVHAFTLQNHSGANRNAWAPFRSTNSRFIVSGIPQQATANAGVSGIPGIANNGTLTFSIQPRPNLPPGIYAEIVPIAVNTAAIPLTLFIRVQFTVTDNNASTLSVSPSILDFGDIVHGQVENVSYQTVTVRNISTNTVALENKSASANFEFGDFSTNTLAPGDSATFTVRPRQDIAGGSHNETIVISGTGGAQGTFQIRANLETVNRIEASILPEFRAVTEGYELTQIQTVTIRNTGSSEITLDQPTASNFEIGELSNTVLQSNESATFTVRPMLGLAANDYSETIYITGSYGTQASVEAIFTVVSVNAYVIQAFETELNFGTLPEGYAQVTDELIIIQNIGENTVELIQPRSLKYEIGDLSQTTLPPNATATFTIRPANDLYVGNHDETIVVRGNNGAITYVNVEFNVTASTGITASQLYSFGTVELGYEEPPVAQTVTITNIGTSAVTIEQPTSISFDVSVLSATTLAGGAQATFTVRPRPNLDPGEYEEIITIIASDGSQADINPHFLVIDPAAPEFIAVNNIIGVPSEAQDGTPLALTSTVVPSNATNQTIVWSVVTGNASISGSTLTATGLGVVRVRATIANGASETMNFTQEFDITVSEDALPEFVAVTNIIGVPTSTTTGSALTLSGIVVPNNATNQTIVWSVADGVASIVGNIFSSPVEGVVRVRATITGGLSTATDFVQYFYIHVVGEGNVSFYHNITVLTYGNGTAAANVNSATAGTQISLTATPDTGYRFREWQVVSGGISLSGNGFIMPNSSVVVRAVFEDERAPTPPTSHNITVQTSGGGTATASVNSAIVGTQISLTATPNAGYQFREWQVISGGISISGNRFTMPDNPVVVRAIFEQITTQIPPNLLPPNEAPSSGEGSSTTSSTSSRRVSTAPARTSSQRSPIPPVAEIQDPQVDAKEPEEMEAPLEIETIPEDPDSTTNHLHFINPFMDVNETDWFYRAVEFVYQHDLMVGMGIGEFNPNMTTSRAMVVQVLFNAIGRPDTHEILNVFDDVADDGWYADAIKWATATGVVAGFGDGTFRPTEDVTRAHLTLILNNFADSIGKELPELRGYQIFNDDADIRYYAREAIERFHRAAIINGRPDNTFDPQGRATRAEMAAMLHKFFTME